MANYHDVSIREIVDRDGNGIGVGLGTDPEGRDRICISLSQPEMATAKCRPCPECDGRGFFPPREVCVACNGYGTVPTPEVATADEIVEACALAVGAAFLPTERSPEVDEARKTLKHLEDKVRLLKGRYTLATRPAAPEVATEDDPLTFAELRRANVARCNTDAFGVGYNLESRTACEWACALAGEVGEACNLIYKTRNGYKRGKGVSVGDIAKELADAQTYLDLLAARLGVDLAAAVRAKFNEVSQRVSSPIRLATRPAPGAPPTQRGTGEKT